MTAATCSLLTALALGSTRPLPPAPTQPRLSFGRFGPLALYQPAAAPSSVALFISGDGGWNLGVVAMAERLRSLGTLVVGVDVRRYLSSAGAAPGRCTYAAEDFEALSHFVQRQLRLERYLPPVLVGYSSGATLAYVVLAQAPPNTFRGAVSLGFCPDLPGRKPWCPGPGGLRSDPLSRIRGWRFQPAERLSAPWIVLEGDDDQVCPAAAAANYVAQIGGATIERLPKVGHGFAVEGRWREAFDRAYNRIVATPSREAGPVDGPLSDLPIVEVPAATDAPQTDRFAVMLSGDGGWAGIDRGVSQRLAQLGVPVVGLNSLQYFWRAKTPGQVGLDLGRIVTHYQRLWHRERVLVLGYSFGADVAPFALAHTPKEIQALIAGVGLLGLGQAASFEFHVGDWVGLGERDDYPTLPALRVLPALLPGVPVVCLFGAEETDSGCGAHPGVKSVRLPGGHHLGGDFDAVADRLLSLLGGGTG